jgi:hypothetical protein
MFDIESLFADADPVRGSSLPSADSPEATYLYQQISSSSAPRFSAQHGTQVRVIAGVGLAGTAALVAALVVPGAPGAPTSAAAAVLAHLSKVAAGQPAAAALPAGEYEYTASVGMNLISRVYENDELPGSPTTSGPPKQTFSVYAPVTRQVWIATDGSGRLEQSYGTPSFLTPADRAAWVSDGSPDVVPASSDVDSIEPKGALVAPDLSNLPTNPGTLLAGIEARTVGSSFGAPAGAAGTFEIIGELLRETDASPRLRAALYQAAAQMPGMTLIGTVTDAAGRSGTAVAYASNGEQNELIFDPTTSVLLGEATVVTDPTQLCRLDVSVGTVLYETSYVASGVVNSTSDVPEGTSLTSYHVAIPSSPSSSGSPSSSNCSSTAPSQGTSTSSPTVSTTTNPPPTAAGNSPIGIRRDRPNGRDE